MALIGAGLLGIVALIMVVAAVIRSDRGRQDNAITTGKQPGAVFESKFSSVPLSLDEEHRAYREVAYQGEEKRLEHLRAVVPGRLATWREQAEKGNPTGQLLYGICFGSGVGVAKDEAEAARCYRKAADAGYTTAMRVLGGMYAIGSGVTKDEAEAVRWFRKAAALGDDESKAALKLLGIQ